MGGAIDVARGDIDDLRVRTTANGATGSELDARVAKMVAEGDEYFDRRLFIAPARSNAYDSYRAALDLAPGNEAALKGIEKLRAFYAQKAEEARANKQTPDNSLLGHSRPCLSAFSLDFQRYAGAVPVRGGDCVSDRPDR
jgi:hypothetical protein